MAGLAKGSLICCLGMALIGLGCGSPTASSSSRRMLFRNHTYAAYKVSAQSDRLQLPVETWVLPEETRDISLASIESGDHLAISLFSQVPQEAHYRFPDINLEIVLNNEGWVDSNVVSLSVLKEDGALDAQESRNLKTAMKWTAPPSPQLFIEAREFQDSLRVYIDNLTDSTLSVVVDTSGQSDTVKVEKGVFPVSGFIKGSSGSVNIGLAGGGTVSYPREKDLLLQAQPGTDTLRQIFDLPPEFRTGTPKVEYQFLEK